MLDAGMSKVASLSSIVRQHGQPPSSPGDRNGGRAHASYSQDDGAAKIKRQPVPSAWDRPSCPGTDALQNKQKNNKPHNKNKQKTTPWTPSAPPPPPKHAPAI